VRAEGKRVLSEKQETTGNYAITRRNLFKGTGITGAILDLIQKVRGSVVSWVTGKKGKTKREQETPSSLSSSAAGS